MRETCLRQTSILDERLQLRQGQVLEALDLVGICRHRHVPLNEEDVVDCKSNRLDARANMTHEHIR